MPHVLVLQHHPAETPGLIQDALMWAGFGARVVRSGEGEAVPRRLADARALVPMGGPMGVYERDRFPFLGDELGLIEHALSAGAPVLGVCLGSQFWEPGVDAGALRRDAPRRSRELAPVSETVLRRWVATIPRG